MPRSARVSRAGFGILPKRNFYFYFVRHPSHRVEKVGVSLEAFARTLQGCAPQTTARRSRSLIERNEIETARAQFPISANQRTQG